MSRKGRRFMPTLLIVPQVAGCPIMDDLLVKIRKSFTEHDYVVMEPDEDYSIPVATGRLIRQLRCKRIVIVTWRFFVSFSASELKRMFNRLPIRPNTVERNSRNYTRYNLVHNALCPRVDMIFQHFLPHMKLDLESPPSEFSEYMLSWLKDSAPATPETITVKPSLAEKIKQFS